MENGIIRWEAPGLTEAQQQDCVLVDVDGTLAEMQGRSPFEWHRVGEDEVRPAVADLLRILKTAGVLVLIVTGRDGVCHAETRAWLDANGIPYDAIYQRPVNNNQKDSHIKEQIYNTYIKGRWNVKFVLDDRNQVVDMWRNKLGLDVFQVAEGDF